MAKPSIRFIAGAACPSCHKIDKLRYQKELHLERVDCVNCGHHQIQEFSTTKDVQQ